MPSGAPPLACLPAPQGNVMADPYFIDQVQLEDRVNFSSFSGRIPTSAKAILKYSTLISKYAFFKQQ
jgi:hypothetical protein